MKKIFYSIIIAAIFMVYGCEGPQGEVGPKGTTGETGVTGDNGQNGTDGEDGTDGKGLFDDQETLTSYGYIAVALEGTRPATIPFEDSIVFDITIPSYIIDFSSSVCNTTYDSCYFNFYRLPKGSNLMEESGLELDFHLYEDELVVDNLYYSLPLTTTEGDDFYIYDREDGAYYIESGDISNYTYNPATGMVTLTISVVLPPESNSTNKELTMRIYINAMVYQVINSIELY